VWQLQLFAAIHRYRHMSEFMPVLDLR